MIDEEAVLAGLRAMSDRIEALEARVLLLEGRPRPGRERVEPGPRVCEVCGGSFERRAGERLDHFKVRRTCGSECVRELQRRIAVGSRLVPDDSLTGLRSALGVHGDALVRAFEEVELGISVDAWEGYSNSAVKERAA